MSAVKVKMLTTKRGAVNSAGTIIEEHQEGREYELPPSLASTYIRHGWAEQVLEEEPQKVAPPSAPRAAATTTKPATGARGKAKAKPASTRKPRKPRAKKGARSKA